jgi:hypothetical protein
VGLRTSPLSGRHGSTSSRTHASTHATHTHAHTHAHSRGGCLFWLIMAIANLWCIQRQLFLAALLASSCIARDTGSAGSCSRQQQEDARVVAPLMAIANLWCIQRQLFLAAAREFVHSARHRQRWLMFTAAAGRRTRCCSAHHH